MTRGCCNECGYKADYIIDKNNYEDNGYEDLNQVPKDKMICGACYEENEDEDILSESDFSQLEEQKYHVEENEDES